MFPGRESLVHKNTRPGHGLIIRIDLVFVFDVRLPPVRFTEGTVGKKVFCKQGKS